MVYYSHMENTSLKGKCIVVGVTGGIAAYKICTLVSLLKKSGAEARVVMTENARRFVAPLTFETLSGNPVITDTFAEKPEWEVEHIALAKRADLVIVAPATANFIGKYANGIADDFLTTTILAMTCPVLVAPAMNTAMLNHTAVRANLNVLRGRGVHVVKPETGRLACGDEGEGRCPEPETLVQAIINCLNKAQLGDSGQWSAVSGQLNAQVKDKDDYDGKTVLITAGGTREDIDRVRYIGNYSSGKMGAALAEAAIKRGARVIYIYGAVNVMPRADNNCDLCCELIPVKSTVEMRDAVMKNLERADYIVMAAAPADYRVERPYDTKIKSESLTLKLIKNPDIAAEAGAKKGGRKLAIFAAETGDPVPAAVEKLNKKNADLCVANDVTREGAGFGTDTNIATFVFRDGRNEPLPMMTKRELADILLDRVHEK
ncbi:peptidase ClpP [Clostridia bacterium]|nr:peptidase ClpP [Clostridia bacterium]